MKFEVTLRLHEVAMPAAELPECRDAVLSHGRAGFVTALFTKVGADQGFEIQCALTDLRHVLPDAVVTRIEFCS